ncbi:MAG TPA: hypothetical protein VLW51_11815 [Solirubrobacteraceae bacterium]|nr:hypothetical protein [Solirubrobacteraceae bacterium]
MYVLIGTDVLMLVIALIWATIAPWRLFSQQSTVVDKQIMRLAITPA